MNIIKKLVLGSALVLGTTTVSTALDEIAVPFLNYNTAGTSVQVTTTPVDVKVEFINILAPGEAYDSQEFTNVQPNSYGVVSVNFQGTVQGVTETKYKEFGIEGVKTATENYMFRISTRTANTTDEYKVVSYVSVFDQVLNNMASVGNAAEGAEVTNGSVTPAKIAASDNPGDVMLTTAGANVGDPTEVAWGKITNAHVSAVEGDRIAGSKITPDFGARGVTALNFTATDKLIGANLEIGTPDAEEVLADNNGIKVTKDGVIMGMGTAGTDNLTGIVKGTSAAGVIQNAAPYSNPTLFTKDASGIHFTADSTGAVTATSLTTTGAVTAGNGLTVTGTVTLPNGSIENADLATGIAPSKISAGVAGQVFVTNTSNNSAWAEPSAIIAGGIKTATDDTGKVLLGAAANFPATWGQITSAYITDATITNDDISATGEAYTGIDVAKIKLVGALNMKDQVTEFNGVYLAQNNGGTATGAFAQITDAYVAPKVAGTYAGISSQKINFGDGISQAVIFGDASADNFVKIDPVKDVDAGEYVMPMFSVIKSTQLKSGTVAQIDATFTANPDVNSGDSQVGLGVTSEFSGVQTVSILGYKADGFNTNNPTALYLVSDADAIYVEAGKSTLQETVIGTALAPQPLTVHGTTTLGETVIGSTEPGVLKPLTVNGDLTVTGKSTLKAMVFADGQANQLVQNGAVNASFYIIAGDAVLPAGTQGQIVYINATVACNVDMDPSEGGTVNEPMTLNAPKAFIFIGPTDTGRWYKLN